MSTGYYCKRNIKSIFQITILAVLFVSMYMVSTNNAYSSSCGSEPIGEWDPGDCFNHVTACHDEIIGDERASCNHDGLGEPAAYMAVVTAISILSIGAKVLSSSGQSGVRRDT